MTWTILFDVPSPLGFLFDEPGLLEFQGDAFLGMSDEEAAIVGIKVGLAEAVRDERIRRKMTQHELGRLLGPSQSGVAKMEAADRSVSLDLLIRSLLKMGVSRKRIGASLGLTGAIGQCPA